MKGNQNKLVKATINLPNKQIKYSIIEGPFSLSSLNLQVKCPEGDQASIKKQVDDKLKGFCLRNPQKVKPKDLTVLKADFGLYQTDEMKLEKFFSKYVQPDKKDSLTITLEVSKDLGEAFYLVSQKEKIGKYIFELWFNKMSIQVTSKEKYAILEIQTDVSIDQKVNLTLQFKDLVQKVFCISYKFESTKLFDHFCKIFKSQQDWFIKDTKVNNKVFILTKKQESAKRALQYVTSLTCKQISLSTIFQQANVRELFLLNQLNELKKGNVGIEVISGSTLIELIGDLTELMQFETNLHQIYLSYKIKEFEWENSAKVISVLKQMKQKLEQHNANPKVLNIERCYLVYQIHQKSYYSINQVTIWIISKSNQKLESQYLLLLNKLFCLVKEVVMVDPQLTSTLQKRNKGETLLTKLQDKYKVSLQAEEEVIIVSGEPSNISEFKKELKSISAQIHHHSEVPEIQKQNPVSQDKPIEDKISIMLSDKQWIELRKQQIYTKKKIVLLKQDLVTGIYDFSLVGDIDTIISTKMHILSFISRTKPINEILQPNTWSLQSNNSIVVKLNFNSTLQNQKQYIMRKLDLPSPILIEDVYRIENKEYYYRFSRANNKIKDKPKEPSNIFYTSPYPIKEIVDFLNNNKLDELGTLDSDGTLSWKFCNSFKLNKRRQETILLALTKSSGKLDDAHSSESVSVYRFYKQEDFYPQYIIRINPKLDPNSCLLLK